MRDFVQTAEEAARRAGHVLRAWSSKFTVREKSRSNLVTEADEAAQAAIYEFIHSRYPGHGFCGEEGLSVERNDSPYRWVIDPLDGTTNYVHGFPYYCVSIGLECRGEMIVGAVFDPNHDEMFIAVRGEGATLNRRKLKCSSIDELGQSLLIASLPVATSGHDEAVRRFLTVLPIAQSVQRTGSAALNLANVAAGRVEGFWSTSLKPWDMAAGILLVEEAGGTISKIDGSKFRLEEPDLLATNGTAIHQQLLPILTGVTR